MKKANQHAHISSTPDVGATSKSADLWRRAYEDLKVRDASLVDIYEQHLAASIGAPTNGPRLDEVHIQAVIDKRLKDREESQLVIRLGSYSAKVREMGEKVVSFILWSKDIVASALSAQPYAALAWCGVSLLLSVSFPL